METEAPREQEMMGCSGFALQYTPAGKEGGSAVAGGAPTTQAQRGAGDGGSRVMSPRQG